MLIDFNKTDEITCPGMNGGTGMMTDDKGKEIIDNRREYD